MIEVKVLCPCGAKFKFDVEPVNHVMPTKIACPTCGQDVTDLANSDIHQKLPVTDSPPAVAEKPKLRVSAHTPSAPARPPVPMPAPAYSPGQISAAVAGHLKPVGDRSIWFGVVGALVGSFVGMMIWYLLIKLTHFEIGWIAWGVGVLAGVGARVAGSRPSAALGAFAAACTCVAIIGGQFLAARSFLDAMIEETVESSYKERMDYARDGVKAKTDDEIKVFLIQHGENEVDDEGKTPPITTAQVKEFREKEQGELQEFIDGKPSKDEFGRRIRAVRDAMGFQILLFKESFSFFTLLWLFLGMGSAFKLGSGVSDS